jgi:hypothetical protein
LYAVRDLQLPSRDGGAARSSSCRSTPVYLEGPPHGFNMLAGAGSGAGDGLRLSHRRERQPEAAGCTRPGPPSNRWAASSRRRAMPHVGNADRRRRASSADACRPAAQRGLDLPGAGRATSRGCSRGPLGHCVPLRRPDRRLRRPAV